MSVRDGASSSTRRTSRSSPPRRALQVLGLGLITGAADDDPSAIGTYATVGAKLGPTFLWIAPAIFPMMFAVVYLSAKLGQVAGEGLFAVIRRHYPRWVLYTALIGAVIGNTIEAGADLGGMAAAFNLLVPASDPMDRICHCTGHSGLAAVGIVRPDPEHLPVARPRALGVHRLGHPRQTRSREHAARNAGANAAVRPGVAVVGGGRYRIVQGFSTPPLMLLIMRMTNSRAIMGRHVNGRAMNVLGWLTTLAIFGATIGLVIAWFR
ncbi:MAG TPA: divalent metal cation transporter [Gemmatimonadales bacterium]|nr:divalent metal cation transporter [Gemmatimonadales bacterium]